MEDWRDEDTRHDDESTRTQLMREQRGGFLEATDQIWRNWSAFITSRDVKFYLWKRKLEITDEKLETVGVVEKIFRFVNKSIFRK